MPLVALIEEQRRDGAGPIGSRSPGSTRGSSERESEPETWTHAPGGRPRGREKIEAPAPHSVR